MADVEAIRRGLAAQLRTVLPANRGHVSAYFDPAPRMPCLQVAGVQRMERNDFGDGRTFDFVIEGVFSMSHTDSGAQRLLDEFIADNAVDEAVEADGDGAGALYSRLLDDGTVTTLDDPAAASVAFVEYLGVSRETLRTGGEALLATWVVQVVT